MVRKSERTPEDGPPPLRRSVDVTHAWDKGRPVEPYQQPPSIESSEQQNTTHTTPDNFAKESDEVFQSIIAELSKYEWELHIRSMTAEDHAKRLQEISDKFFAHSKKAREYVLSNEMEMDQKHAILFPFKSIYFKISSLKDSNPLFSKKLKPKKLLEERGGDQTHVEVLLADTPAAAPANEPPELRSFAERLDYYRRAAGLSQQQLGERAGIKQSHVSQIERAVFDPRLGTVYALADALGVDPSVLVGKGRGRG